MTMKFTTIGPGDRRSIGQAVLHDRQRIVNPRRTGPSENEEYMGPETYVAKIPSDGIPALNDSGVPGHASCEVYRLIQTPVEADPEAEEGSPESLPHFDYKIIRLEGVSEEVFNVSSEVLTRKKRKWIVVTRDKDGYWWPILGQVDGGGFPAEIGASSPAPNGRWRHSWIEQAPLKDGDWEPKDGGRTGSCGAGVRIERIRAANPSVPEGEIWEIEFIEGTGGTARLSLDGTQTGDIPFDATQATIQGELTTAGGSFSASPGPLRYLFNDTDEHEILWTKDNLLPRPVTPAFHHDGERIDGGKIAKLSKYRDETPEVIVTPADVTVGEVTTKAFDVEITATSGTYTATWTRNAFDPQTTAPINFDANAAGVQAALTAGVLSGTPPVVSNWSKDGDTITYTVTAADSGGTAALTINGDALKGEVDYRFEKGTGDEGGEGSDPCNMFDPSLWPGFTMGVKQGVIHEAGSSCPSWQDIGLCTPPVEEALRAARQKQKRLPPPKKEE